MQEFDLLYRSYSAQPNVFNKFNSHMKSSKLFGSRRGPLNLQAFKEVMRVQKHIFLDSEAIRAEYTFFVCFKMQPEHAAFFERATVESQGLPAIESQGSPSLGNSFHNSTTCYDVDGGKALSSPKRYRALDAARATLSQYEEEIGRNSLGLRFSKPSQHGSPDKIIKLERLQSESLVEGSLKLQRRDYSNLIEYPEERTSRREKKVGNSKGKSPR